MTPRPVRERILLAMWVLVALFLTLCAALCGMGLFGALFGNGSDDIALVAIGLLYAAGAGLPMILVQYIVVGYASPARLLRRG
jgi:hypothetical protein